MPPRLLQPGDRVIDYSGARPAPHAIARAGARGVCRYSAGAASDPHHASHSSVSWKLITPREFEALLSVDLDVIANDEWYTTRITEGAKAGEEDARAAAKLWHSCGLAEGAAIYSSWDSAPLQGHFNEAEQYLARYRHVVHDMAGYEVGTYAGKAFLEHWKSSCSDAKHPFFGWRPDAESWSDDGLPFHPRTGTARARRRLVERAREVSPANMVQLGNTWFNHGADENIVLRVPLGSHLDAKHHGGIIKPTAPPAKPRPKPGPGEATRLVSPDGRYALELTDFGKVEVAHDGKKAIL